MDRSQKIKATHLMRKAVDYVRQSTMRQVYENAESTRRQYALKDKLVKLGWPLENIVTIDCDLGQSGSGSSEREGFKELVAAVGNNEVGAIACLEMSRLARNSQDWCRLMEICSITQTILIDEDGIYDINEFNDRMLLGLKGTMSEAELHYLHSRMRGGALSKAGRGELRISLPIGYVYDEIGKVTKDPDIGVQSAVNQFFEAFRMYGSAAMTVRHYFENGIKMPRDLSRGFSGKELVWGALSTARALDILHNPVYAGIYAYGQVQTTATISGKKNRAKPLDEWHTYLENHHEGYISEDEYKVNLARLSSNNTRTAPVPPPREGCALLQGIAICGICFNKMSVHYRNTVRHGENTPHYECSDVARHLGGDRCQYVHGTEVDRVISDLVLERLTPMAIKNAIEVEEEVRQRETASDNYFVLRLERARYEVGLAKKRYMSVDPANRLVAFELEKIWNQRITEQANAEEDLKAHENAKNKEGVRPSLSELMSIPDNVKEIWNSENVQLKDKKRIIRCLVEDVTITKDGRSIRLGVRFKTGASTVIECKSPPKSWELWTTSDDVVELIRGMSALHTKDEIAEMLTEEGLLSGKGFKMNADSVGYVMRKHNIPSLQEHLKARGFLTAEEKAAQLNVSKSVLHKMKNAGKLDCEIVRTSGKGENMFSP